MNVNNVELNSINNKLKFNNTQKEIDSTIQKIFGQDAFQVDAGNSKNQLFKIGENNQEDIEEALSNEPSEFVKGALTALGKTTTAKDLSELDEEGYHFEDEEVDTIVTVTDKIQIYLATHCDDYQATGDISMEEVRKVAGNSQVAYEIANKLQENNLPVTKENIDETKEALEISSKLKPISDGAAKYIINNRLSPTIENIYKAEFSGIDKTGGTYAAGYFSEGTGYYGKTTDEFQWDSLKDQISKVIQSTDLEVNEDSLSDAKWLMENHIPLTTDTLHQYETLKDMTLPVSQEDALNSIMQAIQEGKSPSKARLTNEASLVQRANDAYQVIQNTTDENVKSVIANERPVTIDDLKRAQKDYVNENELQIKENETTASKEAATGSIKVSDDNITFITARRQLEEIRLQMTVEANYKLLKQGISIETSDLQSLVEALKNAEDSYYKQLLGNSNIEESNENVNTFKEITTKLSAIKYVPNTVLGSVVSGKTANTINGIHTTGTVLKGSYEAANQSYEALMTKPRSDMGDHINKAFQNVDDILADLGLETTSSNQRAVRILGYNSMEISMDNISAVKSADLAVNQTISNLTPQIVLRMIREGINPLDMNINELNNRISDMKLQLDSDDTQEKYSEFLWKLEKSNDISPKERETFIGMYRLLNNVEKTDGQVVGALVNQNAEITLNNLLTGIRNIKNKGMDIKVDDNFGELESLTFESTSISDQLKSTFESSFNSNQDQASQQELETVSYYNNLVDQALKEITPEKLFKMSENESMQDMSLEKFVNQLIDTKEDTKLNEEYYQEKLTTLEQAAEVESNVIKMLKDFNQPVTINNIIAANSMMNNRGGMFKKLLSKDKENNHEITKSMEHVSNSITSKEDLTSACQELENTVMESINKQSEETDITSIDLKELKMRRNEIRLTTNLSQKERYEVPIIMGDEVTSINLTIIRGTDAGKVSVSFEQDRIGKVTAEFSLKEGHVTGYIAADNQKGIDLLKAYQNEFETQLRDSEIKVTKLNYITSKSLNMNQLTEDVGYNDAIDQSSTKDLYSIARAFIVSIKNAGNQE